MSERQPQNPLQPEEPLEPTTRFIDPICEDGREILRLREHAASPGAPTLLYLPGIHGDWTMLGAFRARLGPSIRLLELTYPRSTSWSLQNYAEAIESALSNQGVNNLWLLGESFGSQVLWELVERSRYDYRGLILAGGFVKYPYPALLHFAQWFCPRVSVRALQSILPAYIALSRLRHGAVPEAIEGAREFVARRTALDLEAAIHRLELIRANDPRSIAEHTQIPLHHLYGAIDPIVPWPPVANWLRTRCRSFRGSRRILACDHTVLATGADLSAEQVRQWMA